MPTASRAIAALALAMLLAATAHFLITPRLPEWRAPGHMVPVAAVIGAICGWRFFASKTGPLGMMRAASVGVTASVIAVILAALTLTAWLTLRASMRRRYHGLEEAFEGWLSYLTRETEPLWSLPVLGAVIVGGALIGMVAGFVGRYAR